MKRSAPGPQDRLYAFGSFLADPVEGVLYRDGRPLVLASKSFEVLVVLLERRNRLVPKDELLKLVWADTFVEENNLARHISTLRKALSDHAHDSEYITTLAGRGYRFVAPVREIVRGENEAPLDPASPPAAMPAPASALPVERQEERVDARAPVHAQTLSWRFVFICAALVAIAGLALVAVRGFVGPRGVAGTASAMPDRKLWQLTTAGGLETEAAWGPDSRTVAYSSDRSGNFDIWVQPLASDQPTRLTTSPADDWQPAWSPDGRSVAFRSERDGGGLFVVPSAGGEERRITPFGYAPQWSNREPRILFYDSGVASKLYLAGMDGAPPRRILTDFLDDFSLFRAAWHPDGQRVSVYGNHKKYGWSFWTVPVSGAAPTRSELAPAVLARMQNTQLTFSEFRWAPKGDAVYLEARAEEAVNVWRVSVDPQTLQWRGGPERLTTSGGQDTNIALSPDGTKIAFTSRNERTRVWKVPFNPVAGQLLGSGAPITPPGIDAVYPVMRKDGSQLAYRTSRRGQQELWRSSQSDGDTGRVASADEIHAPRWSQDGEFVAYRRLEKGGTEGAVVLVSANGAGEQVLTTPGPGYLCPFDWSKDGAWILASCQQGAAGLRSLCLLPRSAAPAAEKQMRVIASDPDRNLYQASFSPDQRWIAFQAANHSTFSTIYVMPAGGGPWIQMTEGGFWDDKPRWSPDGRSIYFVSNRLGFFDVWGRRFDPTAGRAVGEPFRVTHFESPRQRISTPMLTMDMTVGPSSLILPIAESSGSVWILENIDR